MYATTVAMLTGTWNFITRWAYAGPAQQPQEAEILAVETDTSGRKRRAVSSGSFSNTPESPKSQGTNLAASSPAKESTTPSRSAPGTPSNVASSDSQGSTPSSSPPKKPVTKTYHAPGAFPTPEMSKSPPAEQPKQDRLPGFARNRSPRTKNLNPRTERITEPADPNPALGDTNHFSIYPTKAEVDAYARSFGRNTTLRDWEICEELKKQECVGKELELVREWAARQDYRLFESEEKFWQKEGRRREAATETAYIKSIVVALKEKFGQKWVEKELHLNEACHEAFHSLGRCHENNETKYIFHRIDELRAHEEAKIFAEEVAEMSPEEKQAFSKTSANKKFRLRSPRSSGSPPSQQTDVKAGQKEGTTQKYDSRPTTSSSHKPASYKGGMAPSPNKNDPGADHKKAWSYDPAMPPGPSVLRVTKKDDPAADPNKAWSHDPSMRPGLSLLRPKAFHDAKNKQVDELVERGRKLRIESPQEARFKKFMTDRRARSRERWEMEEARRAEGRNAARTNAAVLRADAEKFIAYTQLQWAQQKQAEEEEAARVAAEKLIEEAAIEKERARKAAEEAAKLKAAQAAEDARKAEEAEKAAAAEAAHATKQVLIRSLDPEWAARVQAAMDTKSIGTKLATGLDGTPLSRRDFGTLLPQAGTSDDASGWLNDEIINAFITAIVARKKDQTGYKKGANSTPAYESLNSAWWTTYSQTGITSIKRWLGRKGVGGTKLLKAEKLFLPINGGAHWQLLIVSPRDRNIEILNSLTGKVSPYITAARALLKQELGENYIADEWTETTGRSNRQHNSNDCGVFVAMNALAAAKEYPFTDVTAKKMPDARHMIAGVLINGGLTGDWEL